MDKDGTRVRNGRPLRFTIVTNDRPERVAAAEEIARQLGQVGAHADVQAVGWTGMVADVLQPGRFQAALVESYDPSPISDPTPFLGSKGALNFGGWASPRTDEILARARSAGTPAARAAALRDLSALVAAETPAVPLFNPRLTYLVAPELRGQSAPLLVAPRDRFAGMNGWYLLTRRAPGRF